MNSSEPNKLHGGSRLGMVALILLAAGWIVAVLFGDGLELYRTALAMPLVVAGGLCGLPDAWRSGRTVWTPALVVGAFALIYFAARAILSPVWDLGRHDLCLIALAWITLATVAACARTPGRAGLLLAAITIVFLAHFGAALYQRLVDSEWALLRLPRHSAPGASGLFWHRNTLAASLALSLPLFLGAALAVRNLWVRIVFGALVAAGLLLAYWSKSRAGFAAVGIGLASVGVVLLLWRARTWSWSARLAVFSGIALAGLAAAVAMIMVVSQVSAQRGHADDLEEALSDSFRLPLAGVAVDLWLEQPVFGHGSQSFRYLAIKNWDEETLGRGLGNVETVHNEYLQVLADYGLLGFVLLMAFGLILLSRMVISSDETHAAPLLRGLELGAAGALVGTMFHALVEFQLHLLPVLLLAAVAVGILVRSREFGAAPLRGLHMLTVLGAVAMAAWAAGRESLAAGNWLSWQREVLQTRGLIEDSKLALLKAAIEASPHYEPALHYGRLRYEQFRREPESEEARERLEDAAWALALASRRHPYDPSVLVTHGLVLDQLGRHEEATPVHVRAVEMAARRENKYGAMGSLGTNLAYRGEALWLQREAERALGYYLLAEQYLEASTGRLFKFEERGGNVERRRFVERRITLLQNAGIQPQSPSEVRPPPKDR